MRFLALRIAAAAPAKRIRTIARHDSNVSASASARGVLRHMGNASAVVLRSFGTPVSDVARGVRQSIPHALGRATARRAKALRAGRA